MSLLVLAITSINNPDPDNHKTFKSQFEGEHLVSENYRRRTLKLQGQSFEKPSINSF